MEEALEILWTYARREPLDSNGETIVPTINNSIAAIRIIMRLEGWESEKRKGKPSENLELGYVGEKRATHNKPAPHRRGEWQFAQSQNAQSQFAQTKFAQTKFAQYNTDNDTNNHNEGELLNMGELPFAPTPAQHQYPQPNTAYNNYPSEACACLVAPSPKERGLGERNLLSFTRHTLPAFAPPLSTLPITRC